MEANIVKVGNSEGVIILSKLLKMPELEKKVKINVQGNKIINYSPGRKKGPGWLGKEDKKRVEQNGQPEKLMPNFFDDEENNDWAW